MPKFMTSRAQRIIAGFFLVVLLVGNGFFLRYNAFRFFNTLDMGGYLDAAWRVYRGQVPFIDFMFHKIPLDLYLSALFFHLFGFGKAAVLAQMLTIHSVVILLVFFMLYRRVPLYVTLAVTVLTVPSYYWSVSFPWHDQSAHLWSLIAVSLLVWQMPFKNGRRAFLCGAACGFLSVVAFMIKTNIGPAYGLAFLVVLLTSPKRIKALGGFFAGIAVGIAAALLLIRYPKEFFDQTAAYSMFDGARRLKALLDPRHWLVNYYWAAPVVVFGGIFFTRQKRPQMTALFLSVTFVAIYCVITGGMIKPANNFLWGAQMALAFIVLYSHADPKMDQRARRFFVAAQTALLLMVIVLTVISIRYGLQLKAWTYNDDHPEGEYVLYAEPLKGWRFHLKDGLPLDQLSRFIKERVPPEDSILNLTDLYIIYALTDRDSFRGIPPFFFGNAFPAPGPQLERVRETILKNSPDWIIVHFGGFDNELMFLRMGDMVRDDYVPIMRSGLYVLLRKK